MSLLLSLILLVAVTGQVQAHHTTNPNPPGKELAAENIAKGAFSEVERRIIRDFFRHQAGTNLGAKAFTKGKVKSKQLPPGLAMHLRHGSLPPGLQKRLPSLPSGLQRRIVGNDVVLIETATSLILDVLRDVLR